MDISKEPNYMGLKFAVHSGCCNAHWELIVRPDNTYDLVCEKCHTPAGSGIEVTGPDMSGRSCDECGEEPT